MNGFERWATVSIWAAAVAGTVLTAAENRWFRGVFAAVLVGVAVASAWRYAMTGRQLWAATILSIAGGIALYAVNASAESVCVARNAAGERVIIGTEFTKSGARYHDEHPHDDANAILESLGGLGPHLAWTAASIQRCRVRLMVTGALWLPSFGAALIFATALVRPSIRKHSWGLSDDRAPGSKKRVFISYSHEDAAVAVRVRDVLARNNVDVIIDIDSMAAGQRIQEFIERSVRESDVIVSIVSNSSLQSAWVAMETIHAFHRAKAAGSVLVPCTRSDDFLNPEFRLECTRKIDERLEAIERLIPTYAAKKIDPVDLHEEKTRLYDLRNNLGAILAVLKGSLCLDLSDARFEQSSRLLVATIGED